MIVPCSPLQTMDDFEMMKVLGKGTFGKVGLSIDSTPNLCGSVTTLCVPSGDVCSLFTQARPFT